MPRSLNVSEMRRAPSSEVAVPATAAPSPPSANATAWPMPRLAPVTKTSFPCNGAMTSSALRRGNEIDERLRVFQRHRFEIRRGSPIHACEHAARTAFYDLCGAHLLHPLDNL